MITGEQFKIDSSGDTRPAHSFMERYKDTIKGLPTGYGCQEGTQGLQVIRLIGVNVIAGTGFIPPGGGVN